LLDRRWKAGIIVSMKKIAIVSVVVVALTLACGTAGDGDIADAPLNIPPPADRVRATLPFSRGVNFSAWFEAHSPREIIFSTYTEQDFINAKSLGVDVIRLPIRMHSMTGGSPDYILDPLFLRLLDQVIDWAERHEIFLILDNHSFDPRAHTSPDIYRILLPVWRQIAERYRDRSEFIIYEILNEPHGIDAAVWAEIQGRVVEAIREIDATRYIIVGGVDFNSIDRLFDLPTYPFDNIIYTFHFYDPYLFTHQGETWASPPNLINLRYLPFPADRRPMPPVPPDLRGTWVEGSLRHSYRQAATIEALARQLDRAVQFSRERGDVPIFCGEFGVFIPNTLPEDRLRWYEAVVTMLDDRNIPWTSWDYFGGFGIFRTMDGSCFYSELNVELLNVMGFTPPPQGPQEKIRNAFTLFDSYPNSQVARFQHWGSQMDLFYPNGQRFALGWSNADRYGTFIFHLRREADWEYLAAQGYAITFTARTTSTARIDVRLVNREGAGSIPWRLNAGVDLVPDGNWHTLRVPLSSLQEQGAWISATQEWVSPEGGFAWDNVASLAFVAEEHALHGITIIFDTIRVEP